MTVTLAESQAVTEVADLLYSFLPGRPHPYADARISFEGVARDVGIGALWQRGSKLPAIVTLLERTLDLRRDLFCKTIVECVRRGMSYRANKQNPITRDEIRLLNELVDRVGFKIPELWDSSFLETLPTTDEEATEQESVDPGTLSRLKSALLDLEKLMPSVRGLAFEKFLKEVFGAFGLEPKSSFRLVGEQIDGSLQLDGVTYLLEAKWQTNPIGNADLLIFQSKVQGKSSWGRGLLISHSGFTEEGRAAFSRGRSTSILGMTGQDLYFVLEGQLSLSDAIRMKARHAAETGEFLIGVQQLLLERQDYHPA